MLARLNWLGESRPSSHSSVSWVCSQSESWVHCGRLGVLARLKWLGESKPRVNSLSENQLARFMPCQGCSDLVGPGQS